MIQYKNVVVVSIVNDMGQIALQLRAAHDDSFPSHWDFAIGGGIDENEDPKDAAIREAKEELGIAVDVEHAGDVHFQYPAWNPEMTREVDLHMFKTVHNGPFTPDPNEVEKVEFFTKEQVQTMIDSGEKFHPELIYAWNHQLL